MSERKTTTIPIFAGTDLLGFIAVMDNGDKIELPTPDKSDLDANKEFANQMADILKLEGKPRTNYIELLIKYLRTVL